MKLVKSFNLKDIREYEYTNDRNVLDLFKSFKICNLLELIIIGNNMCSEDDAINKLDTYLENGGSVLDAFLDIKEELTGKRKNEDSDTENSELIDISKYESLTELYDEYCAMLMKENFGYSEFWDLSTRNLFRIFETLSIKRQNEINQSLSLAHAQAAMFGQAMAGKLKRKPPQVKLTEDRSKKDVFSQASKLQSMFKGE